MEEMGDNYLYAYSLCVNTVNRRVVRRMLEKNEYIDLLQVYFYLYTKCIFPLLYISFFVP